MIGGKASISDALVSLAPGVSFVVRDNDYDQIEWLGEGDPPTLVEVEAEIDRLEAEYISQDYARQRAAEYPAIGDQLDALFHAGIFPEDMTEKLQAVKDKYPKSN